MKFFSFPIKIVCQPFKAFLTPELSTFKQHKTRDSYFLTLYTEIIKYLFTKQSGKKWKTYCVPSKGIECLAQTLIFKLYICKPMSYIFDVLNFEFSTLY